MYVWNKRFDNGLKEILDTRISILESNGIDVESLFPGNDIQAIVSHEIWDIAKIDLAEEGIVYELISAGGN